jgi:muconolactone delta-isomerase
MNAVLKIWCIGMEYSNYSIYACDLHDIPSRIGCLASGDP